MPDQVLLIGAEEIVELEARCSECKNTSTFDLLGSQIREGPNCPFCGAEWKVHKDALTALREGLRVARRSGELIKLRVRSAISISGMQKR